MTEAVEWIICWLVLDRRLARLLAGVLLIAFALPACTQSSQAALLDPTLKFNTVGGSRVAFQSGIPVPTFTYQPRPRLELGGSWRIDRILMDTDLSLRRRSDSLKRVSAEAGGREQPDYDDSGWPLIDVPGSFNPPPSAEAGGAWYRRQFELGAAWAGGAVTLKFGAVNYVADVWLNGKYLGYHEGGSTPFAFDATDAARPGAANLVAVRVDNPQWGTRQDIVPWGLTDWWNYGGITQPVWLELTSPLHLARADVIPHLDGLDISVVLHQRGGSRVHPQLQAEVLPAAVTVANLEDPNPQSLVPAEAVPLGSQLLDAGNVDPDGTTVVHGNFAISQPDLWSPASPALYVLHVSLFSDGNRMDELYESFGLRKIAVDPAAPRLLLNGERVSFGGVALHDERVYPGDQGRPRGGPVTTVDDVLVLARKARQVNVQLIRADHKPANPILLGLADRLGFAIWEEIPLYHYAPLTFAIAMKRGIPQQMLTEMDLRDMNHPSVLFHGLANESRGQSERKQALARLNTLDHSIDGTRLTGQAAYGSEPDDRTSDPLDVAGYTFYYGVFYGDDAASGTAGALEIAHKTHPKKPILALEFGRWADSPEDLPEQRRIFTLTYSALAAASDASGTGFVGAALWWTLDDYWTQRPGLEVEHFGLYSPSGEPRPVALSAALFFGGGAGQGEKQHIVSSGTLRPRPAIEPGSEFMAFLGYAVGMSVLILGGLLLITSRLGRQWRSSGWA
jgi:beta-glucuronidase